MNRSASAFEQQGRQADVDQLGRLLADDVDAEQLHVAGPEEELEEPVVVADDLAPGVGGVRGPAGDVGDLLLDQLLLGRRRPSSIRGSCRSRRAGPWATFFLYFRSKAWTIATRACSIEVEARAGTPITSPAA